jgi:hypothetical protein
MSVGQHKERTHKEVAERRSNSALFTSGHLHGISDIVYSERRLRARGQFFF